MKRRAEIEAAAKVQKQRHQSAKSKPQGTGSDSAREIKGKNSGDKKGAQTAANTVTLEKVKKQDLEQERPRPQKRPPPPMAFTPTGKGLHSPEKTEELSITSTPVTEEPTPEVTDSSTSTENEMVNGWPKVSPFGGEKDEDVEMFIARFKIAFRWAKLPKYPPGEEGKALAQKEKVIIMMDSLSGKALKEVNLFKKAAVEEYDSFLAALMKAFPVSKQLITAHEMREARGLQTYHKFTQTVDGTIEDPEAYLEKAK